MGRWGERIWRRYGRSGVWGNEGGSEEWGEEAADIFEVALTDGAGLEVGEVDFVGLAEVFIHHEVEGGDEGGIIDGEEDFVV